MLVCYPVAGNGGALNIYVPKVIFVFAFFCNFVACIGDAINPHLVFITILYSIKMFVPRLTIKLLKTFGLNRTVFRWLAPFANKRVEIDLATSAESRLGEIRRDPSGSSMGENNVATSPKYNLQVIIPAYNVEKYIVECICSVLNQNTTYSYVVYIVNDGSTDRTRQLIRPFERDPRVVVIDQENRGLSGARNAALKNVNAEYVTFVDSDDVLDKGAIQALLDRAYALDADVVQGNFKRFMTDVNKFTVGSNLPDASDTSPYDLLGFAWGKVYRSSLFSHLQFPEGYWYEDTMCNFLILPQCNKIATVHHNVYCYRKSNKGSITHQTRSNPKCLDSYYITKLVLKEHQQLAINDVYFTDRILNQIKYNTERAIRCLSKQDLKCLFVLHCQLFDAYKEVHTQHAEYNAIQEALESRRFWLLLLYVLLY